LSIGLHTILLITKALSLEICKGFSETAIHTFMLVNILSRRNLLARLRDEIVGLKEVIFFEQILFLFVSVTHLI